MQCSHHPMLNLLLSSKNPLPQPVHHLNTEHDITWYRIAHLIGCLGQPNQLVVKIKSVPAESRTDNLGWFFSIVKILAIGFVCFRTN